MTVGERLKRRRKELGMSAEAVAEKLGVSPSTVYRYENRRALNLVYCIQIAHNCAANPWGPMGLLCMGFKRP